MTVPATGCTVEAGVAAVDGKVVLVESGEAGDVSSDTAVVEVTTEDDVDGAGEVGSAPRDSVQALVEKRKSRHDNPPEHPTSSHSSTQKRSRSPSMLWRLQHTDDAATKSSSW